MATSGSSASCTGKFCFQFEKPPIILFPLSRIKMLNLRIMHECIKKLLTLTDEESLECLCKLVTTVGAVSSEYWPLIGPSSEYWPLIGPNNEYWPPK